MLLDALLALNCASISAIITYFISSIDASKKKNVLLLYMQRSLKQKTLA
jgi:hypothetical protein